MIKEVFTQFQAKLDAIALYKKQCETVARIEKVVQRRQEIMGKDMADRQRKQIRNTLMFLVPPKMELSEPNAGQLIYKFLNKVTGDMRLEQ